ncbi:MAG: glycosyltransferase family 2 protein [Eubacteriales bacterium]|nr:glycosyltransferase family 2 protein [Eubacteriales bacterium]
MAKVSICIPAYKNPVGVRRLLESICIQDYRDFEVVITDDSPDDRVERAAMEFRDRLPGLSYFRNPSRRGATGNWNEAVRHAGGELIKIMHHDDWFTDKTCLGRFVRMLEEHPEADLAFCGSRQVMLDAQGNRTGEEFDRGISREHLSMIEKDFRDLYIGDYIGAPSATIYRKGAPEYEERLTWIVDVEFYMRLLAKNPRFAATTEPLVSIGVSLNQLTESCRTDGELNVREYGFVMQEFGLEKEKKYRDKIIAIALKYKMPYSSIASCGIPAGEYRRAAVKKWREDMVFYMGVAYRKLTGRR